MKTCVRGLLYGITISLIVTIAACGGPPKSYGDPLYAYTTLDEVVIETSTGLDFRISREIPATGRGLVHWDVIDSQGLHWSSDGRYLGFLSSPKGDSFLDSDIGGNLSIVDTENWDVSNHACTGRCRNFASTTGGFIVDGMDNSHSAGTYAVNIAQPPYEDSNIMQVTQFSGLRTSGTYLGAGVGDKVLLKGTTSQSTPTRGRVLYLGRPSTIARRVGFLPHIGDDVRFVSDPEGQLALGASEPNRGLCENSAELGILNAKTLELTATSIDPVVSVHNGRPSGMDITLPWWTQGSFHTAALSWECPEALSASEAHTERIARSPIKSNWRVWRLDGDKWVDTRISARYSASLRDNSTVRVTTPSCFGGHVDSSALPDRKLANTEWDEYALSCNLGLLERTADGKSETVADYVAEVSVPPEAK